MDENHQPLKRCLTVKLREDDKHGFTFVTPVTIQMDNRSLIASADPNGTFLEGYLKKMNEDHRNASTEKKEGIYEEKYKCRKAVIEKLIAEKQGANVKKQVTVCHAYVDGRNTTTSQSYNPNIIRNNNYVRQYDFEEPMPGASYKSSGQQTAPTATRITMRVRTPRDGMVERMIRSPADLMKHLHMNGLLYSAESGRDGKYVCEFMASFPCPRKQERTWLIPVFSAPFPFDQTQSLRAAEKYVKFVEQIMTSIKDKHEVWQDYHTEG